MSTVNVPVEDRSYDIIIQPGLLKSQEIPGLKEIINGKKLMIVTDSNVAPLYAEQTEKMLSSHGAKSISTITFPAGEQSKTLDTMGVFYSEAVKAGLNRSSMIIALGGGVTGDMAGFLAASYMRGIDFIQIPTSLLAMVDSSVGGKTGIDLPEGKNLVGAFWQPKMVLVDLDTLKTLPEREISCGLAEIVKYGIIRDAEFFAELEAQVDELKSLNFQVYEKVIHRCCEIKAEVVAADEREGGIRAILNLGHTFGHSIETLGGYSLLNHGEGVAIGSAMAAELSSSLHLITPDQKHRQIGLLEKLGLPTVISGMDSKEILEGMRKDKKVLTGRIRLVLPADHIGHVIITDEIPEEAIIKAIETRLNCCSVSFVL